MPTTKTGNYYENFRKGRVFVIEKENLVTIKAHQTWEGKDIGLKRQLCISWKSGKPIVYCFAPNMKIRNFSYKNLNEELSLIFKIVVDVIKEESQKKIDRIKKNFLKPLQKIYPDGKSIEALNVEIIKIHFPLLKFSNSPKLVELVPLFANPLIRKGFKKNIKQAVKIWFGRTDDELVRRVASLIENLEIESLALALACRHWNLDSLNQIIDLKVPWNINLKIEEVNLFLSAYSESQCLSLLKCFKQDFSDYHDHQELCRTIAMFGDLIDQEQSFYYPTVPRSFSEICDILRPQHYLDLEGLEKCLFCSYYHGKNNVVCSINPSGRENCSDFESSSPLKKWEPREYSAHDASRT